MRRPVGREGVSPVIAVILLVAITVVLTSVLYVIVTNMAEGAEEVPPFIYIGEEQGRPPNTWVVLGANPAMPLLNFKVKLFIDGFEDFPSTRSPLTNGTVGNVTFIDQDQGNTLSEGDLFVVAVEAGHTYELTLFWKGRLVDSREWSS